jgi:spermidine synthase
MLTVFWTWLSQRTERFATHYVEEIHRVNSNFGLLQVLQVKDSPRRYYLNDFLTQNTYDTNRHQGLSMFTYALHGLARAYTPKIDDVLCIGMGIGLVPMDFAREGARVEVVEINPTIVPVAQKFFDLDLTKFTLHIGDGRHFLNETTNHYDAVVLDAFLGDSSPSHLMTREAFAAIRHVLRPDGVLVINAFADPDPENDFFAASLFKTLAAVFPSVRIHRGHSGNTLFIGSLRTNAAPLREPDFAAMHPFVVEEVRDAFRTLRETDPAHGRVLTDDFNPVEFYDAKNRERIRRTLALNMKD